MTDQLAPVEPQKKSCLERIIILFIRLLFALVVGVAIGVGIYFGIRLLYNEYQALTRDFDSRITALETSQVQTDQLVTDRFSNYQTRVETLEIQGDNQKDSLTDLESRLDSLDEFRSYQATVVPGQQEAILNMQETILALQAEVSLVQTNLETLQNSLSGFQEDIIALETNTRNLEETLQDKQSADQDALQAMSDITLDTGKRMAALEHKMTFLVAMELMTRSRLNLVQGNYTLAQSDLEAASLLLTALQEELPPFQAAYVSSIVDAIDDLLTYLPGAPLTAADKLESVWQLLAAGLPDEEGSINTTTDESTPSPTPTLTPTPKP